MHQRIVRPPPKVVPQLPQEQYRSPPKQYGNPNDNFDFEAAVQEEMARLEREMNTIKHTNVQSEIPIIIDSVNDQNDFLTPHFQSQSQPPSQSPRHTKGAGISNLYGPNDNRQNMKAARAAAYSHQLQDQIESQRQLAEENNNYNNKRQMKQNSSSDVQNPYPYSNSQQSLQPDNRNKLNHNTSNNNGNVNYGNSPARQNKSDQGDYGRNYSSNNSSESYAAQNVHNYDARNDVGSSYPQQRHPAPHNRPVMKESSSSRSNNQYDYTPNMNMDNNIQRHAPHMHQDTVDSNDYHIRNQQYERQLPNAQPDHLAYNNSMQNNSSPQNVLSPSKKPTEARDRLIRDVYGNAGMVIGGGGPNAVDPRDNPNWRPSAGLKDDSELKRRANLEHKMALEKQIEDNRIAKENERIRLEKLDAEREMKSREKEQAINNNNNNSSNHNNNNNNGYSNESIKTEEVDETYHSHNTNIDDRHMHTRALVSNHSPNKMTHHDDSIENTTVSPGKKQSSARNQLINDVYGSNFVDPSDNSNWKPSARNKNDSEAKRRANLEHKLALDKQIEENRLAREMEAKKLKELEENGDYDYTTQNRASNKGRRKETVPPSENMGKSPVRNSPRPTQESTTDIPAKNIAISSSPSRSFDNLKSVESVSGMGNHQNASNNSQYQPPNIPYSDDCANSLYNSRDINVSYQSQKRQPQFLERREVTPGGALASQSVLYPVDENEAFDQETVFSISNSATYKRGIDEEADRFLVEWQHHNGFPTKRGITPQQKHRNPPSHYSSYEDGPLEQSMISNTKFVSADIWAPDGLLAELGAIPFVNAPPRAPNHKYDNRDSLMEKSMTSESFLIFAGARTPVEKVRQRSIPENISQISVDPSIEDRRYRQNVQSNSPLSNLLQQSHESHEQIYRNINSNSNRKNEFRSSHADALEQLIDGTNSRLRDNLLLETNVIQSYDSRYSSNFSNESFSRSKDNRNINTLDESASGKEELLIVPSSVSRGSSRGDQRYSNSNTATRSSSSIKIEKGNEFQVSSVTDDERAMMKRMLDSKGNDNEVEWQEVLDDETGQYYYWNNLTSDSTWEKPARYFPYIESVRNKLSHDVSCPQSARPLSAIQGSMSRPVSNSSSRGSLSITGQTASRRNSKSAVISNISEMERTRSKWDKSAASQSQVTEYIQNRMKNDDDYYSAEYD